MEDNKVTGTLEKSESDWVGMERRSVTRSIGRPEAGNWVGCGFMKKPGIVEYDINIQFPFYSLVYVIRGTGKYIDEKGKSYALSAGSLFQRHPGVLHSTYIDPESNWYEGYIDYNKELYNFLVAMGILESEVPVYQTAPDNTIETEISNLMEELENGFETDLPDTFLKTANFVRSFLNAAKLLKQENHLSYMVEKSCHDFSQSCHQRIDLKAYCKKNGWGYETFRKTFQQSQGISPGKYLIRRRMDTACQLLRTSHLSISEIAFELGYKSQYEFSAQFKRQIGMAPSYFRIGSHQME